MYEDRTCYTQLNVHVTYVFSSNIEGEIKSEYSTSVGGAQYMQYLCERCRVYLVLVAFPYFHSTFRPYEMTTHLLYFITYYILDGNSAQYYRYIKYCNKPSYGSFITLCHAEWIYPHFSSTSSLNKVSLFVHIIDCSPVHTALQCQLDEE